MSSPLFPPCQSKLLPLIKGGLDLVKSLQVVFRWRQFSSVSNRIGRYIIPCSVLLQLLGGVAPAAETPETVLIRQTLNNEKFGWRRGDIELVMSAFSNRAVVYDGGHRADPRGWSVLYADRSAVAAALEKEFAARRYTIDRVVPFIHVRNDKAMATTVDSGQVVDRQSGDVASVKVYRLWTFIKQEHQWLATSYFQNIEDGAGPAAAPPKPAAEIVEVLEREAANWEEGNASTLAGLFDEEFIGFEGYNHIDPIKWVIAFSDADDLESFLEKRFALTTYSIEREVLHTDISENGQEVLALTEEKISASPRAGSTTHKLRRNVLWTLSRQQNNWQITHMFYNLKIP